MSQDEAEQSQQQDHQNQQDQQQEEQQQQHDDQSCSTCPFQVFRKKKVDKKKKKEKHDEETLLSNLQLLDDSVDSPHPGLFVGSARAASNSKKLSQLGITLVVCCARSLCQSQCKDPSLLLDVTEETTEEECSAYFDRMILRYQDFYLKREEERKSRRSERKHQQVKEESSENDVRKEEKEEKDQKPFRIFIAMDDKLSQTIKPVVLPFAAFAHHLFEGTEHAVPVSPLSKYSNRKRNNSNHNNNNNNNKDDEESAFLTASITPSQVTASLASSKATTASATTSQDFASNEEEQQQKEEEQEEEDEEEEESARDWLVRPKIFCHCVQGKSRSVAMCASVMMFTKSPPLMLHVAASEIMRVRARACINAGFGSQLFALYRRVAPPSCAPSPMGSPCPSTSSRQASIEYHLLSSSGSAAGEGGDHVPPLDRANSSSIINGGDEIALALSQHNNQQQMRLQHQQDGSGLLTAAATTNSSSTSINQNNSGSGIFFRASSC